LSENRFRQQRFDRHFPRRCGLKSRKKLRGKHLIALKSRRARPFDCFNVWILWLQSVWGNERLAQQGNLFREKYDLDLRNAEINIHE
jgi:hypothetical protein